MGVLCRSSILLFILSAVSADIKCAGNVDCIKFEECKGLYESVIRNYAADVRQMLKKLHCGFNEKKEPLVCCPPVFADDPVGSKSNLSEREIALALLPDKDVCGVDYGDRIYYGQVTAVDEHPWMALLRNDKLIGNGFYCGGALISKRYVLTAAHCILGPSLKKSWKVTHVRLGEWNVSSAVDCFMRDCNEPALDVRVEKAIVHDLYERYDVHQKHDIALLRLAQEVAFTDFVKPICLPIDPSLKQDTFEDRDLEVAGWGQTQNSPSSEVKLKVSMPVVKKSTCEKIYKMTERNLNENQICAGGNQRKDSCRGDSGGPLMGQVGPNWTVLGVVSYGPSPCGVPGWPGVYTRVPAYVDWILSKLRE